MAMAFGKVIASFDESAVYTNTDSPVRIYVQKDGLNVGFRLKRVGAWRKKKDRNRRYRSN